MGYGRQKIWCGDVGYLVKAPKQKLEEAYQFKICKPNKSFRQTLDSLFAKGGRVGYNGRVETVFKGLL